VKYSSISTIPSTQIPDDEDTEGSRNDAFSDVLPSDTAAGWHKKVLPTDTTAYFPLSRRQNNLQTPGYLWLCNWVDTLTSSYTTFTERGTFHTYRAISTQVPINMYTEADELYAQTKQDNVIKELTETFIYTKYYI